jgi:hypothetical protein
MRTAQFVRRTTTKRSKKKLTPHMPATDSCKVFTLSGAKLDATWKKVLPKGICGAEAGKAEALWSVTLPLCLEEAALLALILPYASAHLPP